MTATRSFYCVYDTVGAFYTFLLTTHFFDCVLVIKIVPPEMPGALILAMVVIRDEKVRRSNITNVNVQYLRYKYQVRTTMMVEQYGRI